MQTKFFKLTKSVDLFLGTQSDCLNIFMEIMRYETCHMMSGAFDTSHALIKSIMESNRVYGTRIYPSDSDLRHIETYLASVIYYLANFNKVPYDSKGNRVYILDEERKRKIFLDKELQEPAPADIVVKWRSPFLTFSNVFSFSHQKFLDQFNCLETMTELRPWYISNSTYFDYKNTERLIDYYNVMDDLFAPLQANNIVSMFHKPYRCKKNPLEVYPNIHKNFISLNQSKLDSCVIAFVKSMQRFYESQDMSLSVYKYKEMVPVKELIDDSEKVVELIVESVRNPNTLTTAFAEFQQPKESKPTFVCPKCGAYMIIP